MDEKNKKASVIGNGYDKEDNEDQHYEQRNLQKQLSNESTKEQKHVLKNDEQKNNESTIADVHDKESNSSIEDQHDEQRTSQRPFSSESADFIPEETKQVLDFDENEKTELPEGNDNDKERNTERVEQQCSMKHQLKTQEDKLKKLFKEEIEILMCKIKELETRNEVMSSSMKHLLKTQEDKLKTIFEKEINILKSKIKELETRLVHTEALHNAADSHSGEQNIT